MALLSLFLILPLPTFAGTTATPKVHYLAATDRLSIHAENCSLRTLLAQIVLQTSVDISMAQGAETRVTLNFSDLPLETGLKTLVRAAGVNHLMVYGKNGVNHPMVLALKVLPAGVNNTTDLTPVITRLSEAAPRARGNVAANAAGIHTLVQQRWEERLPTLTPIERQAYEFQVEQQQAHLRARNQRNLDREQNRRERLAEREERIQAAQGGDRPRRSAPVRGEH